MTRETAKKIVDQLNEQKGPTLTILEAMMMTRMPSDAYDIYAITKGDVTFMAWIQPGGYVRTKYTCW